MKTPTTRNMMAAIIFSTALLSSPAAYPQTAPPESGELLNLKEVDAAAIKTENGATISKADDGLKLEFPAGGGYPGADFKGGGAGWDLSGYTAVEIEVVNMSPTKISVGVRVDNPGDWKKSPWNTEVAHGVAPEATKVILVTFGQSYGKPGFALDPANVKLVKIFVANPKEAGALLIKSINAVK